MALSVGLDTALTGLRAAQTATDVVSHNIANANTDGFTRQVVDFQAIPAVQGWGLSNAFGVPRPGLGVDASDIRRLRDAFLDFQYRDANSQSSMYQRMVDAFDKLQVVFNEPTDGGLNAQIAQFFSSFRDVASQPESVAARASVVQNAANMTSEVNRVAQQLVDLRKELDQQVSLKVQQINTITSQVADLNQQIVATELQNGNASDLRDRRDLLVDQLSGLVPLHTTEDAKGSLTIYTQDRAIVDGAAVIKLTTVPDGANSGLQKVVYDDQSQQPVTVGGGELGALLAARDQVVPQQQQALDALAQQLITSVNAAHQAGYGLDNSTGLDFFVGNSALTIGVSGTLLQSPEKLALSSQPNEPGNSDNASAIVGLQSQPLMSGGTATLEDFYRTLVATLGVGAQKAQAQSQNQQLVLQGIEQQRQGGSGVSLDEESTNLIRFQRAYEASARVVTVVDGMLDTLINRTGVLG